MSFFPSFDGLRAHMSKGFWGEHQSGTGLMLNLARQQNRFVYLLFTGGWDS